MSVLFTLAARVVVIGRRPLVSHLKGTTRRAFALTHVFVLVECPDGVQGLALSARLLDDHVLVSPTATHSAGSGFATIVGL